MLLVIIEHVILGDGPLARAPLAHSAFRFVNLSVLHVQYMSVCIIALYRYHCMALRATTGRADVGRNCKDGSLGSSSLPWWCSSEKTADS